MSLRHVIFLGAGASKTSRYPLANELRLRLSGDLECLAALARTIGVDINAIPQKTHSTIHHVFEEFKTTIQLFRRGGFGTVDEFSKLASAHYPENVLKMKHLVKLALSLHDPEENFHESDYYPFVQRLFDKNLYSWKHNITILSYNYDCYLEFLFLEAQSIRSGLIENYQILTDIKNNLTSGFYNPESTISLASPNVHFRHFKLHGSIVYANEEEHNRLFRAKLPERINVIDCVRWETSVPPIVFPWELFDKNGAFIEAEEFIFVKVGKRTTFQPDYLRAKTLHNVYKSIWQGAQEAVQKAEKISFVGMSMHEYLEDGLEFLFHGKKGKVEVVVANTANENRDFRDKESVAIFHIGSPRDRVRSVLEKVAPEMELCASSFDVGIDGRPIDHNAAGFKSAITARNSFQDFIEKEME